MILNLGCGNDMYGDERVDFMETISTTRILNLEEGRLPYEDNSFDEIRLWRILEHIKNMGTLISECFRVLKKGGKLDLITDHAGYIFYYIKDDHNYGWMDRKDYIKHKDDHHYHLFVDSHLRYLLKDFSEIETSYPKFKRKWWRNLILYSLPFKLGYSEIKVVAIK